MLNAARLPEQPFESDCQERDTGPAQHRYEKEPRRECPIAKVLQVSAHPELFWHRKATLRRNNLAAQRLSAPSPVPRCERQEGDARENWSSRIRTVHHTTRPKGTCQPPRPMPTPPAPAFPTTSVAGPHATTRPQPPRPSRACNVDLTPPPCIGSHICTKVRSHVLAAISARRERATPPRNAGYEVLRRRTRRGPRGGSARGRDRPVDLDPRAAAYPSDRREMGVGARLQTRDLTFGSCSFVSPSRLNQWLGSRRLALRKRLRGDAMRRADRWLARHSSRRGSRARLPWAAVTTGGSRASGFSPKGRVEAPSQSGGPTLRTRRSSFPHGVPERFAVPG